MDEDAKAVCLCMNVPEGAIRRAIAEGARDFRRLRKKTRAGAGPCGAVRCGEAIREMLLEARGDKARD
ncbi:MAG: (2Fe-2S)-binding protein [Candidatus Methylomirabilis sp.]|nr:(2Fe-2S)-binding protein [Deltaproteobacteria bacterium]